MLAGKREDEIGDVEWQLAKWRGRPSLRAREYKRPGRHGVAQYPHINQPRLLQEKAKGKVVAKRKMKVSVVVAVVVIGLACRVAAFDLGGRLVLHDAGKSAHDINATVNLYKKILGGDDNGSEKGPLAHGQRSINWDAGIVPFEFPGNFFQKTVTRGLRVSNRDNKFRVGNPEPANGDDRFSSINPRAAHDFLTFSPKRLFAPLNDNKVTVTFSIPGKHQRALVAGFGAVYVDVDKEYLTQAIYYDVHGRVLAKERVDAEKNGLSFLGVVFAKPVIAKVELILGQRAIGVHHGRGDFVVLDDFFYAEPQAIARHW